MKSKRRWMTALLDEVAKAQPPLPWARGKRRAEWKAQVARRIPETAKISATA